MSKNTPTLLKTAAEMRSNGASWAVVGRTVGRSPRTCEQWPRLFRPAWDDVYRDAEQRRFTETGGEATAVLQGLLRDGDDRTKLRSADLLLRTRHQRSMHEPATAVPLSVADTAARYRAIPLAILFEKVLNPAVFAARLAKCCTKTKTLNTETQRHRENQ